MIFVYKLSTAIWQYKKFVNQTTFAEVMIKSQLCSF